MSKFNKFCAIGTLCLLSSAASAAPITLTNQGFESGLTGWTATGNVFATASTSVTTYDSTFWTISAFGAQMAQLNSNPINGLDSFFGVANGSIEAAVQGSQNVTNGAGIKQTFSGNAGDVLTQSWDFVARDYTPFNDSAFVVINNVVTILASIQNGGIAVGTSGHSGWQTFSYTLPTTGTYTIGFGVVNTGDQILDAALFLDNAAGGCSPNCPPDQTPVPEPVSLALLGLGLAGLGWIRRKKA